MEKIGNFIALLGRLLLNPIKLIASTNVPERFFIFMNKHAWVKILLSFVIMILIIVAYYVIGSQEEIPNV